MKQIYTEALNRIALNMIKDIEKCFKIGRKK